MAFSARGGRWTQQQRAVATTRSGVRERTRQRRGTRERERARGSRGSGRRRGEDARRRGGQATQAGSLVAWRPRARRRAPLCLPGERKQVAGTGQHSAGPASGLPGGLAAQVSGPGE